MAGYTHRTVKGAGERWRRKSSTCSDRSKPMFVDPSAVFSLRLASCHHSHGFNTELRRRPVYLKNFTAPNFSGYRCPPPSFENLLCSSLLRLSTLPPHLTCCLIGREASHALPHIWKIPSGSPDWLICSRMILTFTSLRWLCEETGTEFAET